MGIFDFLKKFFSVEEKTNIKLKFENLENWLAEQSKKNLEEENRILRQVNSLIGKFKEDITEKNKTLKNIDLKEKKAEENIKLIVLNNLSNYSTYLEKLTDNLAKLETKSLENLVNDINRIFSDFKQKSAISFEKATLLIGSELEDVKKSIESFFKELDEIIQEKLVLELKILESVKTKLQEIEEIKKIKLEITNNIEKAEKEIKNLEEKHRLLEQKIESIKKSAEYTAEQRKKEEARINKEKIEKEIFELKNLIDLKFLAKTFHENEKKMNIIKSYEANFNQLLEKEESEINDLLNLIDETKKYIAQDKIKEINKKRKKILEILNKSDALDAAGSEILSTRSIIESLISEKTKSEKKIEKLEEDVNSIKKDIKEKLSKMNVLVE